MSCSSEPPPAKMKSIVNTSHNKKTLTNRGRDDSCFVVPEPREPLIARRRVEPQETWHARLQSEGLLAIYCAHPEWTALLWTSKRRLVLPDHVEHCMTTEVAEAHDGYSKNLLGQARWRTVESEVGLPC